jgi:mono/diheme cytochrome c family protein
MMSILGRFGRRAWPAICVALALSFFSWSFEALSQPAETSVLKGVYSEEQSKRGEEAYKHVCIRCHKADLMGGLLEPALVGPEFFHKWGGSTVGALFDSIQQDMPKNHDKGTLQPQLIADVIAYVFKQNGFPSGTAELPTDLTVLKGIRIEQPSH